MTPSEDLYTALMSDLTECRVHQDLTTEEPPTSAREKRIVMPKPLTKGLGSAEDPVDDVHCGKTTTGLKKSLSIRIPGVRSGLRPI